MLKTIGIVYQTPTSIVVPNQTMVVEKIYHGLTFGQMYYFKVEPLVHGENAKLAKAFVSSYFVTTEGPILVASQPSWVPNQKVTRFRAYSEIDSTTGIPTVKLSCICNWYWVYWFIIEKS